MRDVRVALPFADGPVLKTLTDAAIAAFLLNPPPAPAPTVTEAPAQSQSALDAGAANQDVSWFASLCIAYKMICVKTSCRIFTTESVCTDGQFRS